MSTSEKEELQKIYLCLKSKIDEYLGGAITADQLKPAAAPFGIYEQRNGMFMIRIRITGGHITSAMFRDVAEVMARNGIPHVHLSSRQDIQLHDVAADKIYNTVVGCDRIGLPFRGGGGNTYRNILASADSGFAPNQVFDVLPYAQQLNAVLRRHEKAFGLPRKLKIGFFASPSEEFTAAIQDLGFLAVKQDGRRGFKVYGGGGMGRESSIGVKLFDFLPEDQYIRCAAAMVDLFNDHGDRQNRNRARIRFIIQNIGADAFIKLFMEYFGKAHAAAPETPKETDYAKLGSGKHFKDEIQEKGFDEWRAHAVLPTGLGDDLLSVRLYVPYGNLTIEQVRRMATLSDDFGGGFLRFLPSQDILISPVHSSRLAALHHRLLADFSDIDLTLKSFKGHIICCVGAGVCKIGVLSAPKIADMVAEEMDKILPADTPRKIEKLKLITSQLRISGCPNACSGHPSAKIGIQGQKQRVGEVMEEFGLIFTGVSDQPDSLRLSVPAKDTPAVKADGLPLAVSDLLDKLL